VPGPAATATHDLLVELRKRHVADRSSPDFVHAHNPQGFLGFTGRTKKQKKCTKTQEMCKKEKIRTLKQKIEFGG
jgi:hypothetical protein